MTNSEIKCKQELVCAGCLGHAWLVADVKHRGVTVYPCSMCNKDEKLRPIKIDKIGLSNE